jgi:hypothetical protein
MTARAQAAQATAEGILDAAVELFTDRMFEEVTLGDVAARAGGHEEDGAAPLRVQGTTLRQRYGPRRRRDGAQREEAPVGDAPAAVANVVDHYERWGTNRLRLLGQEDRIGLVAEHVRGGRTYHRNWVERTFAPQLAGLQGPARKRRIAALVAATDVYTWKLLRQDLGFSRAETERTLVEMIG